MNRRSFLKSLAAIAGITVVPSLGISLPNVPEPVKWVIEEFEYGSILGVAAQWGAGNSIVRHAVMIDLPVDALREKSIAYCKQAIRQWYLERHVMKKAA